MSSATPKDKDHDEDETNSTADPSVVGSTGEGENPLDVDFAKDLERCEEDDSSPSLEDDSQCEDLEINGGALPHIIMFVGLVFVLVLGVFQIVMIGSKIYQKNNAGPTGSEISQYPDLPFEIEEVEYQTLSSLENPSSPQSQALNWLAEDFKAHKYSKSRSFQRFHMAVIYYSFNGQEWTSNESWLDHDVHECLWFNRWNSKSQAACEFGTLVRLDLSENNLSGFVPAELETLQSLQKLDLSGNHLIMGEFPAHLCELTSKGQLQLEADCLSTLHCC